MVSTMTPPTTERIILAVKTRPVLWDLTHKDYRNHEKKYAAWADVTNSFLDGNVDNLTKEEKDNAIKGVQQRWKSARDQYVRKKTGRRNKKDGTIKRYCYEDLMTFLDSVTRIAISTKRARSISKSDSDDQTSSSPSSSSQNDTPVFKSEKLDEPEQIAEQNLWEVSQLATFDEDVAFFSSLLPTVRQLDIQKKLTFKAQVMQLLAYLLSPASNSSDQDVANNGPAVPIPGQKRKRVESKGRLNKHLSAQSSNVGK